MFNSNSKFNSISSTFLQLKWLTNSGFIFSLTVAIIVWIIWFSILGSEQITQLLANNWTVSLTMLFGSIIAGGTSVGGGAVAFPVFTKVLMIPPDQARIFSLAIQSIGMTAASLTIIITGIPIAWSVILWASLGGLLGFTLGVQFLLPIIPPDVLKISFSLMLTSLAIALILINQKTHNYYSLIKPLKITEKLIISGAGIVGGVMSSLVGNGIDIIVFSVIVLLFKLNEKIATPTSVVIMAINAIIGFLIQIFWLQDFSITVQNYWLSSIPVVVLGAPLGALICSKLSREIIVNILISLIMIELVSSLLLIPLNLTVMISGIATFLFFSGLNYWMYHYRNSLNHIVE
jgi:uncharacterized membrane protein YfcA